MRIGVVNRQASDIAADFAREELIVPSFQRGSVWEMEKQLAFIERTLQLGFVLGSVLSYRLTDGSSTFLSDGQNRIRTLRDAIDDPEKFGLSKGQLFDLKCVEVVVQTAEYESHVEAMKDFQNINDGTPLIAYEKYRGEVERDEAGKAFYRKVREHVSDLVRSTAGYSVNKKVNRKRGGQDSRQSLAMFLMFAANTKGHTVYKASEKKKDLVLEVVARRWFDSKASQQVSDTVKNFANYLHQASAEMTAEAVKRVNRQWSATTVRGFFAAKIFCRNMGVPSERFSELVGWYLDNTTSLPGSWPARFSVDAGGNQVAIAISNANVKWLDKVAEAGGPKLIVVSRKKTINAPAGYHESHVTPHVDGGTEVFVEPGSPNLQRGRRPVAEGEGSTRAK